MGNIPRDGSDFRGDWDHLPWNSRALMKGRYLSPPHLWRVGGFGDPWVTKDLSIMDLSMEMMDGASIS